MLQFITVVALNELEGTDRLGGLHDPEFYLEHGLLGAGAAFFEEVSRHKRFLLFSKTIKAERAAAAFYRGGSRRRLLFEAELRCAARMPAVQVERASERI